MQPSEGEVKQMKATLQNPTNLLFGALLMACASLAFAGTTGTEFLNFYNLVLGWAEGYLGRGLAIASLIIGVGIGMVRGTIMPAMVGVGIALIFAVGPSVVNGIVSAVI
jgi:conjugal transfer pilus assembly protein TraA